MNEPPSVARLHSRFQTFLRESNRAGSQGSDLASKMKLAFAPAAERALRRLGVRASSARRHAVRIGAYDLTYRLNAGDIQGVREVLIEEAYRLPFPAQPRSIVDLGANIGLTTMYYCEQYSPACVVAVEPDPCNVGILRQNVASLGATVVQAAVAPTTGTLRFSASSQSNLGRLDPNGTVEVQAVTMNELLDLLPGGRADLVKIDIEGGEGELFSGDCRWLARVDAIIIELHPPAVDAPAIVETIQRAGFRYVPAGSAWPGSMDAFVRHDDLVAK